MRWFLWFILACLIGASVLVVTFGIGTYLSNGLAAHLFFTIVLLAILVTTGCMGLKTFRRRKFAVGYKLINTEGIEIDLLFKRTLLRWNDIVRCDTDKDLLVFRDGANLMEVSLAVLFFRKSAAQAFFNYIHEKMPHTERS